ncbi:MAG: TSUP family transporter [Firmicutes bacterium]|nr:TSUP family transporter [Bacillota bacterium]MDY4559412.1 TSUP family transporter [Eubacteriales bacterium]
MEMLERKYFEDTPKKKRLQNFYAVLGGLAVGFANGFFGAGGGMLAVPVLTFIMGLEEKKAHATALLIILPLSIISSIIYGKSVSIGDNFLEILLGVLIGGILGALLLKKLNTASLVVSFYFLMAFAGFQMIR